MTLALCLASLLAWSLASAVADVEVPNGLRLMPLSAVIAGLLGAALLHLGLRGGGARPAVVAGAGAALAGWVLLEYLLGLPGGLERQLLGETTRAALVATWPGRPAPQSALTLLLLGGSLWLLAGSHRRRFELADLGAGLALFGGLVVLLGHLFEAQALYKVVGSSRIDLAAVEAVVLLLLAGGTLGLNPQGAVAALTEGGPIGAARRRVLALVVVVPIGFGLLQYLSVSERLLDYSVALALAVTGTIAVLIALADWSGRTLQRIEQERTGYLVARETQAKVEGMTDILTGLANRRGWDRAVADAQARCVAEGLSACVIIIDLDGLKHINDTQGHARGDEFIRRASGALKGAARKNDCLARLGGDEFASLSLCSPEHGQIVLKRLAQALSRASVPASLGYAMSAVGGDIAAAIQQADKAMYEHKRARKAGEGATLV